MALKQIDMHGKRLKEAEETFYEVLNDVRLKKLFLEITFITGTGPIQEMLKRMATEQGLNWYVPMSNKGCLVVEFE